MINVLAKIERALERTLSETDPFWIIMEQCKQDVQNARQEAVSLIERVERRANTHLPVPVTGNELLQLCALARGNGMERRETLKIMLAEGAKLPVYQTRYSSGMDLHALLPDGPISIPPGRRKLVPTGVFIELPEGTEAQVRTRSGMANKNGGLVLNSPGTIDEDYRGEIKCVLQNTDSFEAILINNGDRIAQMVIVPVIRVDAEIVDKLSKTIRGSGGFGSTGVKG